MTAGKLQQQAWSNMPTLKGSLLAFAIITLISFTYLSLDSLQSSSSSFTSSFTTPVLSRSVVDQPLTQRESVKLSFEDRPDVSTSAEGQPLSQSREKEPLSRLREKEPLSQSREKEETFDDSSVISTPKTKEKDEPTDDLMLDLYHSPKIFKLNYEEMERNFKVYIYPDGDPDTFYQTPRKLTGKYASEGYFFQNIRESRFRTEDPNEAHLFFIPISCHKMRGKGTSYENMTIIVQNYLEGLIAKYPYWNRTLGADHFFVTCHDVGVRATEGVAFLVKNAIRVVCSPSYNVGFIPHKDVALPQVLQPFALPAGGNDVENRTILGFWAGHRNSKIRVILARVWENDTELAVNNNRISRATGELVYQKRFYRTKFCICPGGSQVNSARIADSIHYGCVPVILSNYYDLPFNDILDWRKFAVILKEKDVYQLKRILKDISDDEFKTLHKNLVGVQKHFQWNSPPIKYDAFHMVMYELWLRHHVIKY